MAHRVDAPGNVANKFVEPDSGTGAAGTDIGAEWLNDTQENVVRAVEGAGLTPVKGTDAAPAGYGQLLQAIRIEAGRTNGADFKNLFVNGSFDLWRRQQSSPPSFTFTALLPGYAADRWYCSPSGGGTCIVSRQDLGVGGGRAGRSGRYALQFQQTVNGVGPFVEQRLESVEKFDGQSVTISVDLKVASGTLALTPYIRQDFGVGGSAAVQVSGSALTVTTTWTRFTVTLAVPSIAGKTLVGLGYLAVGLRGPGATLFTLQVAAAQVEYGTVATEYQAADPATELARANRYFWTTYELGTPLFTITNAGAISCDESGTTLEGMNVTFPVPMRTLPGIYFVSPRTGVGFKLERPFGADATVGSIVYSSSARSGAPDTTGVAAGLARAHVIADAEI